MATHQLRKRADQAKDAISRFIAWAKETPKRMLLLVSGGVGSMCFLFGGALGFNAVAMAALITAGVWILILKLRHFAPGTYRAMFCGKQSELKRLGWDAAAFGTGFALAGGGVTTMLAVGISGLFVSTMLAWLPEEDVQEDEQEVADLQPSTAAA